MQSLSISPCCKSNCHTKVQDCYGKYKIATESTKPKCRHVLWWNWPVPRTCPFPSYSPPRVPSPSSRTSSHSPWLRSCAWPRIQSHVTWVIFYLARWSRRRLLVKRKICSQMWHLQKSSQLLKSHSWDLIHLIIFQLILPLDRRRRCFQRYGLQTYHNF